MNYGDGMDSIRDLRRQIARLREKIRIIQRNTRPQPVADYSFRTATGMVKLSELFGVHDALIVVHNMGASCQYCNLWADGFNGLLDHLQSRIAFAVASPDSPAQQAELARQRGWRFRMVSHNNSDFAADMGHGLDDGWLPGASAFRRGPGGIVRVSDTVFDPEDEFCTLWHLFGMFPDGTAGWTPANTFVQLKVGT